MEEVLIIEPTDETPKVVFDPEKNIFEISGRSMPEDTVKFYLPVQSYIKSYINNPNPKTDFIIKLEYFNTSSARKLVEILFDLEEIIKKGKEIKVFWLYAKDDELIEGKGREIMSVVKIPFELRAI